MSNISGQPDGGQIRRDRLRMVRPPAYPPLPSSPFLTLYEVAEILTISPHTLRHWRMAGKGPVPVKLEGRMLRFERGEVERWLKEQRVHEKLEER